MIIDNRSNVFTNPTKSMQQLTNDSHLAPSSEAVMNMEGCWGDEPTGKRYLPAEFCMESSLHGLRFIGQPKRHVVERYLLSFTVL